MGIFYDTVPDSLRDWVLDQKMFCVATAPLAADQHVNMSPKGGESFGLIDNRTFWYLDFSGSGCETIAHIYENGRVTIMFMAFEGSPKIVRFWGQGRVLENNEAAFEKFVQEHDVEVRPGARSIILVDIERVGSSCGFSVPFYSFQGQRTLLRDNFKQKCRHGDVKDTMDKYWALKSAYSVDGLPAMKRGLETGKREGIVPMKKISPPKVSKEPNHMAVLLCLLVGILPLVVARLVR